MLPILNHLKILLVGQISDDDHHKIYGVKITNVDLVDLLDPGDTKSNQSGIRKHVPEQILWHHLSSFKEAHINSRELTGKCSHQRLVMHVYDVSSNTCTMRSGNQKHVLDNVDIYKCDDDEGY